MEDAHCKTVEEVVNYFNVDGEKGLSADQVKRNQEKYGLNGKYLNSILFLPFQGSDCANFSNLFRKM